MKEVAELDEELTIEERNLLSVAYKNIIVGYCFKNISSLSYVPTLVSRLPPSLPRVIIVHCLR